MPGIIFNCIQTETIKELNCFCRWNDTDAGEALFILRIFSGTYIWNERTIHFLTITRAGGQVRGETEWSTFESDGEFEIIKTQLTITNYWTVDRKSTHLCCGLESSNSISFQIVSRNLMFERIAALSILYSAPGYQHTCAFYAT